MVVVGGGDFVTGFLALPHPTAHAMGWGCPVRVNYLSGAESWACNQPTPIRLVLRPQADAAIRDVADTFAGWAGAENTGASP